MDIHREDDVGGLYGIDWDGDADMERDGDDEEMDNDQEEDKEEEDEEQEQKNEEEDKDMDDGKEHRTITQGEMVNISADDVDTSVDDQRIVLREQGQEMREHTTPPQPLAPAPQPQPWRLTNHHWPQRIITSPCQSTLGLWRHEYLAQQWQLCGMQRQPDTPWM